MRIKVSSSDLTFDQVWAGLQGPVQLPGAAAQPVPDTPGHPQGPVGPALAVNTLPRSGHPAPGTVFIFILYKMEIPKLPTL